MRSVRHYETMIILHPSQDERTVAPSLDKYLEIIRKDGGTVDKVDVWGKRRLAYPIIKQEEGVYVVVSLNCTADAVKELDRVLNLSETVMRTKVLRTDK